MIEIHHKISCKKNDDALDTGEEVHLPHLPEELLQEATSRGKKKFSLLIVTAMIVSTYKTEVNCVVIRVVPDIRLEKLSITVLSNKITLNKVTFFS